MANVRVLWLLAVLAGCAPAVQPEAVQVVHLTFSADAWGGLPFTAEAKQQAMVQAVYARLTNRATGITRGLRLDPARLALERSENL